MRDITFKSADTECRLKQRTPHPESARKKWHRLLGHIRSKEMFAVFQESGWLEQSGLSDRDQVAAVLEADLPVRRPVIDMLARSFGAAFPAYLSDPASSSASIRKCDSSAASDLFRLAGLAVDDAAVLSALASVKCWEPLGTRFAEGRAHDIPTRCQVLGSAIAAAHPDDRGVPWDAMIGSDRNVLRQPVLDGMTLLHCCARYGLHPTIQAVAGNPALMEALKSMTFVSPDLRDSDGRTPMHYVALACPLDCISATVSVLAAVGCSRSACDYGGARPGHLLVERLLKFNPGTQERTALRGMFESHFADVDGPNWSGQSAADVLREN